MRYNLAILRELPHVPRHPVRRSSSTAPRIETEAMLVAVGNGPSYGGGMRVTPGAVLDDGLLDVLVLHEISTAEFLRVFPKVFKGTHVGHPQVQVYRGPHGAARGARHRGLRRRRAVRAAAADRRGRARRAHRAGLSADVA